MVNPYIVQDKERHHHPLYLSIILFIQWLGQSIHNSLNNDIFFKEKLEIEVGYHADPVGKYHFFILLFLKREQ